MVIDEIPPKESRVGVGAFKNVDFWMNKAYESSQLNQIDAAIDFYKHGLDVDGNNPLIYYNVGALFALKSYCKKAIKFFEKVEEIIQAYSQWLFSFSPEFQYMKEACPVNIALMYYRLKNYRKAQKILKTNEADLETITTTEFASSSYGKYFVVN